MSCEEEEGSVWSLMQRMKDGEVCSACISNWNLLDQNLIRTGLLASHATGETSPDSFLRLRGLPWWTQRSVLVSERTGSKQQPRLHHCHRYQPDQRQEQISVSNNQHWHRSDVWSYFLRVSVCPLVVQLVPWFWTVQFCPRPKETTWLWAAGVKCQLLQRRAAPRRSSTEMVSGSGPAPPETWPSTTFLGPIRGSTSVRSTGQRSHLRAGLLSEVRKIWFETQIFRLLI